MSRYYAVAGLALMLGMLPGLGGCGFQPLYGTKSAQGVEASQELQRIYVANIPTRFGQEMRLALQQEMAGAGPEHPDGYILKVNGKTSLEAVDIHTDNTSGRSRMIGSANWRLYTAGATPRLLAQGHAKTLDGYNPTIEQYFAQSLNSETLQERVAQNLAHDMTQQVAIWFRSHIAPGSAHDLESTSIPNPDGMPTDNGTPLQRLGADGFPAAATGRLNVSGSTTSTGEDSSQ